MLGSARATRDVQGFFDALDEVNALADASPGFVWRLVGEEGANATDIQPTADPLLHRSTCRCGPMPNPCSTSSTAAPTRR